MRSEPLVTCAFSSYNAENTIKYALSSAFNQTYKNKEFLIVDDFSKDQTLSVIKDINLKNNNIIRIFRNEKNLGIGEVRNQLIKYSNGEFIAFFDDDDYSYPDRIKKQISLILEYEERNNIPFSISPMCYANRKIIYSSKKELVCKSINYDVTYLSNIDGVLALLSAKKMNKLAVPGSTATCTLCARKVSLEKIGPFNRELRRYEDLDLAIRALFSNISLLSVSENLVNQYFKITNYKKDAESYELKLIKNYKTFLEDHEIYNFSYNYALMKHSFFDYKFILFFKYLFYLFIKYPINFLEKIKGSFKTIFFSILNKIFSNIK